MNYWRTSAVEPATSGVAIEVLALSVSAQLGPEK
jgi:hypothetical protein